MPFAPPDLGHALLVSMLDRVTFAGTAPDSFSAPIRHAFDGRPDGFAAILADACDSSQTSRCCVTIARNGTSCRAFDGMSSPALGTRLCRTRR